AMAEDGLFFKSVGWVHPKTRVPIVAIILQGVLAMIIARSGRYEDILNYVVSSDFIFFGLTAICLLVFRRRRSRAGIDNEDYNARVHTYPFLILLFVAVCWLVVINIVHKAPENTVIGLGLIAAGVPAYLLWRWNSRTLPLYGLGLVLFGLLPRFGAVRTIFIALGLLIIVLSLLDEFIVRKSGGSRSGNGRK